MSVCTRSMLRVRALFSKTFLLFACGLLPEVLSPLAGFDVKSRATKVDSSGVVTMALGEDNA